MEKHDDGNCTVTEILSQHPPKTYPPSPTLNPDPGIYRPVVVPGYVVKLPHALQRVNTRYKDRRPRYELIPVHPDENFIRG